MNETPLAQLKARFAEIHNLEKADLVLGWDQRTYMPPGGAEARGQQRATLSKTIHALLASDETAQLLDAAERELGDEGDASDERALLRVARRKYEQATKLPAALVQELAMSRALAYAAWVRAREEDDYALFAPSLARIIELQRAQAQALGYAERMYDALADLSEEGMSCAMLDPLFAELKEQTLPLLLAVSERADSVSDKILRRDYDISQQRAFAERVLQECGFDWSRGRLDVSPHPFSTSFSTGDVRLTTRYFPDNFRPAFFGSLHEMGHGLYSQGIAPEYESTPLGGPISLGIHESQSRLWENLVGRSRAFWSHYFPQLQAVFPSQLGGVEVEEFYRAVNRVAPSCIRVEADELTYNLHIILRYELENELLEGTLGVADAPGAWNERVQRYLGITPRTAREGILQDIHWSSTFGYFPTYSLGNILSAQLWNKALEAAPQIPDEIATGKFATLLGWLRENVHRHGRKYTPSQLVQRATGSPLTVQPYADYLRRKFSDIYDL